MKNKSLIYDNSLKQILILISIEFILLKIN